ncbi:MAG: FeoB-associated Cys-rich membrane protein [Ruminococcaceae bacterium]|nr:FeoB-associated Cys-rich membrane protein [Oscillospiraceae bacterium]
MGIGDWLILGLLAVMAFFAARHAIRHRGSCGGCQGCTGCRKNCNQRNSAEQKDNKT